MRAVVLAKCAAIVLVVLFGAGCQTLRMEVGNPLQGNSQIYKVTEKPAWYAFWTKGPWVYGPYSLQNVMVNNDVRIGVSAPIKGLVAGAERRGATFNYIAHSKGAKIPSRCTVQQIILSAGKGGIGYRDHKVEVNCTFDAGQVWEMKLKGDPANLAGELDGPDGDQYVVGVEHQAEGGAAAYSLVLGYKFKSKGKPIAAADTSGEPDFIVKKVFDAKKKAVMAAASGFFFLYEKYGDKY